jgi:hypothetical protein
MCISCYICQSSIDIFEPLFWELVPLLTCVESQANSQSW